MKPLLWIFSSLTMQTRCLPKGGRQENIVGGLFFRCVHHSWKEASVSEFRFGHPWRFAGWGWGRNSNNWSVYLQKKLKNYVHKGRTITHGGEVECSRSEPNSRRRRGRLFCPLPTRQNINQSQRCNTFNGDISHSNRLDSLLRAGKGKKETERNGRTLLEVNVTKNCK